MIRGSAGCLGIDPTKPKLGQIEFFDEDIDHANRISRRSSLPGVPETAWSDRDGSPQRSASSDPPANRTRILSREAKQAMRFYTGWVIFDRSTVSARYRLFIRYLPNCCITATDVQGQRRNWKIADPAALIPGILSKIRPRNCPDQSYLSCMTDSGPAPGVGGLEFGSAPACFSGVAPCSIIRPQSPPSNARRSYRTTRRS
jgi:hypothetical protein